MPSPTPQPENQPDGISKATSSQILACIVICPSQDLSAWALSIETRAKLSETSVVVPSDELFSLNASSQTVVVTANLDLAQATQALHRIVIVPDIDRLIAAMSAQNILTQGAIRVSAEMAEASTRLCDFRKVHDTTPGGPITLWPGFEVSSPPAGSETILTNLESAWSLAMRAYLGPAEATGIHTRWEPQVFHYDSLRAEHRTHPWEFDLTGTARNLVYGPYLSLTPGRWRSLVRFAVDDYGASFRYRVEWGTRTDFVQEVFVPGRSGIFEIALEYDFPETTQAELRVILTEGSLGGSFEFLGMELDKRV